MTQTAFAFEAPPPASSVAAALEWVTGVLPDRSGMYRYTVLIRADGDPERTPRELAKRDCTAEWRRALLKQPIAEIEAAIVLHMADGLERTMNRIAVEMIDKTADVIHDTPFEHALWALVSRGQVAFTMQAPVLFRKVAQPEATP